MSGRHGPLARRPERLSLPGLARLSSSAEPKSTSAGRSSHAGDAMTADRKTSPPPAAPGKPAPGAPSEAEKAHLDDLLDEALDETFPASDPVSPIDPFRPGTSDEHGRGQQDKSPHGNGTPGKSGAPGKGKPEPRR